MMSARLALARASASSWVSSTRGEKVKSSASENAWHDGKPNGHGSWHAREGFRQRVVTYTGEWRAGVLSDGSTTFTITCDGRDCTFR